LGVKRLLLNATACSVGRLMLVTMNRRANLAQMPLDLGDDATRLGPTGRLVAEIGVAPPNRSEVARPGA